VNHRSPLIIDDDEQIRAVLRQGLEEAGDMVLETPMVRKDSAIADRLPLLSAFLNNPVDKHIAHLSRQAHAQELSYPNHIVPTAYRAWSFSYSELVIDTASTTRGYTIGL